MLPFALVIYLALSNGGYDEIVRSEVGILVWWVVLLGALAGLLPSAPIGRAGWVAFGALAGFGVWTALSVTWTESDERTIIEAARVAVYLGVLALALSAQGRNGLRRTVGAVGAAITVIALISLLSRFEPTWFPAGNPAEFLPTTEARLTYPLNYWNGLAALMAIGLPLLLAVAVRSQRPASQMLATAGLPVLALTTFYTFSRAGALAAGVGIMVTIALTRPRWPVVRVAAIGACGSAVLIAAATQRDALEAGPHGSLASIESEQMIELLIIVSLLSALFRLFAGTPSPRRTAPRQGRWRRAGQASLAVVVLGALLAAIAVDLPSELSDRWQEFKSAESAGAAEDRFSSLSGAGRYQNWDVALNALAAEPLTGIGAGTYEFWWARETPIPIFVRDAHSLFFESLAELGPVGLTLIVGFLAALLWKGTAGALRATGSRRTYLAGSVGAVASFLVAVSLDWNWELAVIPVTILVIGAAICAEPGGAPAPGRARRSLAGGVSPRLVLIGVAIPALILLGVTLLPEYSLRESREAVIEGRIYDALDSAETARGLQPWAASPRIQRALVLERQGRLGRAAASAAAATEREPTNWRHWLILSRLEARRGDADASVNAFEMAASLNRQSPEFLAAGLEDDGAPDP